MLVSFGPPTILLLWSMLLIEVERCVSSLILGEVKAIRVMMHVCSMSSGGKFPLMASRSIILLTRQNRLPCIGDMQRHTVY